VIKASKGLELIYHHPAGQATNEENLVERTYHIEYKWLYFMDEPECEIMCVTWEDETGNIFISHSTGDDYLDSCIDAYMRENAKWVSQYENQ